MAERPDLEDRPHRSHFADEYGDFDSIADLLRQISYDERAHKEESLARIEGAPVQLGAATKLPAPKYPC